MKKLFLLSIGTALSIGAFAQSASLKRNSGGSVQEAMPAELSLSNYRITAIGSIDTLSNIAAMDTPQLYVAASLPSNDSGYLAGMDAY